MLNESKNPYSSGYPEKQRDYLKKIINLLVTGSRLIQKVDGTFITTDGTEVPAIAFTSSYGMSIYHEYLWELKNPIRKNIWVNK
jgi:hypothetical protein